MIVTYVFHISFRYILVYRYKTRSHCCIVLHSYTDTPANSLVHICLQGTLCAAKEEVEEEEEKEEEEEEMGEEEEEEEEEGEEGKEEEE